VTSPNAPAGLAPTGQVNDPLSFSLNPRDISVAPGQPLVFNSVATNTAAVPVTIPESTGQLTVTNSVTGVQVFSGSALAAAPTITLEPGQSWTQSITWPGSSTSSVPTGIYDAYFENRLEGEGSQVGVGTSGPFPIPISPPISISPPPSGIGANITTDQVGSHESLTLTLTNFESGPVKLTGSSGVARFVLKENGKVIWRSRAKAKVATLAPGDAISFQATWPGRPHQGRAKAGKLALYQLTATADGHTATTTFEL
jgi:hypothetical protein